MTRQQAPTLRTVAATAGVDVSTVSRVLNSGPGDRARWAGPDTVERILRTAEELGYRRNPHAASLRTARSQLVGVVVPRLQDFVLATIFEGIDQAGAELGYAAFVTNSLDDDAQRRACVEQLLSRRVDGLVLCDARTHDPLLQMLDERAVPYVLALRRSGDRVGAYADEVHGGRLVAEHLMQLGYRDPAVIAGPEYASTANDRLDGFRAGLRAGGVNLVDDRVARTGFDADAGRTGVAELLARGPAPDAVFATNDFAAIGALGALRARGLRVPDDVGVVGYNDTPLADSLPIPLTTVRSPILDIGRAAFTLLEHHLTNKPHSTVTFTPTLIPRATTRPR